MEAPPRDFLVSFSPILWIIYSETCPLPLICPDEGCLEEPKEAFIYEFAWGNNPQENKTIYSKIGCNKLHYGTILDKTSMIKCKSSEYNIVHGMEKNNDWYSPVEYSAILQATTSADRNAWRFVHALDKLNRHMYRQMVGVRVQ